MSRAVRWGQAAPVNCMKTCRRKTKTYSQEWRLYSQLGFSYVWLLFLVTLLGVGLALTSEMLVTAQQRDKERELLAIGHQFRQAIGNYYEMQQGNSRASTSQSTPTTASTATSSLSIQRQYPDSLEDLLLDQRLQSTKRHLRKVFVDPMTGKTEWGLYKQGGKIVGVFSISERQPIKMDGFEANDASFRQKTKYSEWIFAYPSDAVVRANDNQITKPRVTTGGGLSISSTPPSGSNTN